jgi:CRP-like cAMP-binding protein
VSRAAATDRDTDAMRWKLELTGTSATQARELEAAVDDIGWTRLATRTESRLGLTRVYIATDRGESPEHIATELAERVATSLRSVTRGEPTTWAKVRGQIHIYIY